MEDVIRGLYIGAIPPFVSIACVYIAVHLIRNGKDYLLLSMLKLHVVFWITLAAVSALVATLLGVGIAGEGLKYAPGYAFACFCVDIAMGGIAIHIVWGNSRA